MKVEEATLQFIRDDAGERNIIAKENDHCFTVFDTPEEAYGWLVDVGRITPDPLEKALEAVDLDVSFYTSGDKKRMKNIMRTLYEEATK